MNPALWAAFVGAVILMQAPPGPDSLLVTARGMAHGRAAALYTVLGMTVGAALIQLPLLALGVSSLVRTSPLAFHVLQWAGAAYLFWLGLRLLLGLSERAARSDRRSLSPVAAAREGMVANLMNPWPMTFMVAFLPQFVDPDRGSVALQMLLLGATQKLTGLLVVGTYALVSGTLGDGCRASRACGSGNGGSPAASLSGSAFAWR
ncbi:LysE family translocator [Mesorhizobium abyssinicae]|uniref:LysE family translocator n=1 Tax=Mesorhizobium abyssinicae TaxID=1209958 RepID=UPI002A23A178|nr:LysE family translocator [Mesorhizobium abyssinicae]MDX8434858.1 LysE family translocator [Mesorhizobium abyssinicae]